MEKDIKSAIKYLRDPLTIRSHCNQIFEFTKNKESDYFIYHQCRLEPLADYIIEEIFENYPKLDIPYHSRWRHFTFKNDRRLSDFFYEIEKLDLKSKGHILFELAIISVLLDAGAGKDWKYQDPLTKKYFSRSEGIAIASFNMFTSGFFSSDKQTLYKVDYEGLLNLNLEDFAKALQVSEKNKIIGLENRFYLLKALAKILKKQTKYFGKLHNPRLGYFFDSLYERTEASHRTLSAATLFESTVSAFSNIWPNGFSFNEINLGDIAKHHKVKGKYNTDGLVPFHKLSQWLTYSLVEPLEKCGVKISELHTLTGLPEYRNGGLLLDSKILTFKEEQNSHILHNINSELICEWRALTVSILDLLAKYIQKKLNKTEIQLPLCKILQGGTWSAGRKIAYEKRGDGTPPILLNIEGSIF